MLKNLTVNIRITKKYAYIKVTKNKTINTKNETKLGPNPA